MGNLLTASSALLCPHGGMVIVESSNERVTVGSDAILLATDLFTIEGCPLIVAGDPHPCVTVVWSEVNLHSTVLGDETLSEDSVGMCVADDQAEQGIVQVDSTQARVSGE